MRGPKTWQALAVFLLAVIILLNLKVLIYHKDTETSLEERKLCEQPLIVNIMGQPDAVSLNGSSPSALKWTALHEGQAKVVGWPRKKPGFLTIGIPSIQRINDMGSAYLLQTIASIVDMTSLEDKSQVVVVVFLADKDTRYNDKVQERIVKRFQAHIQTGFLQIVQASPDFYPKLEDLKRNFNDKPDRVTWRAKQVADFAFMFLYSKNISQYYVQIEDDVLCAKGFVPAIREFIKSHKTWALLEFSELGFIGKLFKSEDLEKLARYMLTFYDEQPVDWLLTYFRLSMAQRKVLLRKPTLFQHVGLKSSFDTSKDNKLKDRFFDNGDKHWRGDNPPAVVITKIKPFDKYLPELAYGSGSGFFWAAGVKEHDEIYVIFDKEQLLDRVVVETGSSKNPKDILLEGWVEASPKVVTMDAKSNTVSCSSPHEIAVFADGRAEASNLTTKLKNKTKCLKIVIGETQAEWVIFYQIAVYVIN